MFPPEQWRGAVVTGTVVALLGLGAILFPFVSGIGISIAIGAALVVGAIVHAVHVFSAERWTGAVFEMALAAVYLVGGIALLTNPVVGLVTLTLLLTVYLVASGVFEIVIGLMVREQPGWWSLVVSGALGVLLAGLIWTGFPSSAAWALGLLVGVNLLASGLSVAYLGMSAREEPHETTAAAGAA